MFIDASNRFHKSSARLRTVLTVREEEERRFEVLAIRNTASTQAHQYIKIGTGCANSSKKRAGRRKSGDRFNALNDTAPIFHFLLALILLLVHMCLPIRRLRKLFYATTAETWAHDIENWLENNEFITILVKTFLLPLITPSEPCKTEDSQDYKM